MLLPLVVVAACEYFEEGATSTEVVAVPLDAWEPNSQDIMRDVERETIRHLRANTLYTESLELCEAKLRYLLSQHFKPDEVEHNATAQCPDFYLELRAPAKATEKLDLLKGMERQGDVVAERHLIDHLTFDEEICYLRLTFAATAVYGQLLKAAEECEKKNARRALILDLRKTPGGSVKGSQAVLASMGPNSEAVLMQTRSTQGHKKIRVQDVQLSQQPPQWLREAQVVVLVNGETASGGELIASTLQGWGHEIVGTRTYGKGIVQSLETESIPHGYMLVLTTQEFFAGNGAKVHGRGVTPDIEIDSVPFWAHNGFRKDAVAGPAADDALQAALLALDESLLREQEELGR